MSFAVGIEAIAVDRMSCPDPPNRYELEWKEQDLVGRQMVVMRVRKVMCHEADGGHEYEVEEEL